MPQDSIYVVRGGEADRSRWLTIRAVDSESIELQVENLCNPGSLSNLTRLQCPLYALKDVLQGGFIQIRTLEGFATLSGGEKVDLTFCGTQDGRSTRASFCYQEFASLLGKVTDRLLSAPVPV